MGFVTHKTPQNTSVLSHKTVQNRDRLTHNMDHS